MFGGEKEGWQNESALAASFVVRKEVSNRKKLPYQEGNPYPSLVALRPWFSKSFQWLLVQKLGNPKEQLEITFIDVEYLLA